MVENTLVTTKIANIATLHELPQNKQKIIKDDFQFVLHRFSIPMNTGL